MAKVLKAYPYPVLGHGNDIQGFFEPEMQYVLRPDVIRIDCTFKLEQQTIEKLIADSKAQYMVRIECGATSFRNTYLTNDRHLNIEIQSEQLKDNVEVAFFVTCVEDMDAYEPEGIDPDLAGEPSFVESGDVLANGGTTRFIADKDFDPLKAPVSSFIKVTKGNDKTGPVVIDYEGDSIMLNLSHKDFENYSEAMGSSVGTALSSLVFPALVDALYTLAADDGTYRDSNWFMRLAQICSERNLDVDEPFSTAQTLLGNPLERGLKEIKDANIDEIGSLE